jgi:CheY-like chemotaxis protein
LSGGTILLVEDEPDDADLLIRAFRKAGIENPVRHVEDGDAAVAYLAGEAPFGNRQESPLPIVVLLDLKLPRRSGFEVLAWLQDQPALRRLPVVVLTSSGQLDDVNRAYDLGANSYLVKPITTAALHDTVRAVHAYWIGLNRPAEIGKTGSA